jgi:superfamily II DNA or RNA helicase
MIARITSNQDIFLENVTVPEEDQVMTRFSVGSPGHRFIDDSQRGIWDGIFRRYDRVRKRLPRPLLGELKKLCQLKGYPLVVNDCRPQPAYYPLSAEEITADFLPGITLEDYQLESIRQACKGKPEVGIFDIPTGGGKTEVMAGIIKAHILGAERCGVKIVAAVIAEQRVIIDQIVERLELREVTAEVGKFYAGETISGQCVIVGTIQSLQNPPGVPPRPARPVEMDQEQWEKVQKRYKATLLGIASRAKRAKYLQEQLKKSSLLLVDECDLAVSKPYKNMFRFWFQGRWRYGFSGTPFDPDKPVAVLELQCHLGSVIAEVDRRVLEERGRIVPVELTMFMIDEDGDADEGSTLDIAVQEHIVSSEKFHRLVAGLCAKIAREGQKDEGTLILVDRDDLGMRLQEMIPNSAFIHGPTPKRRRNEVLRAFERREIKVLIGGKIVRRGLDLKGGCEHLIITTGGKLWSKFNQEVGRAVRLNRFGRGRIYDFFFHCNKYLYNHSRKRLKAMVGMGYPTRVVFRNGQVDGALIAVRFRRPPAPAAPRRG